MKRSINRWTTTLATAALLGLPVAAVAKTQQPTAPPQQQQPAPQPTPQPTEPPQQQPTPKPQPTPTPTPQPTEPPAQPQPTEPQPAQPPAQQPAQPAQQPAASAAQPSTQTESPEEHLRQARAAFNDIKMTSIPARNRTEFAELRRHLAALDNPSAPVASSRSSRGAAASTSNWGTEVAAIDKLITQLAGNDTTTGTSGAATPGAAGTAGTSRGASNVAVDEATRAKLMEIRTHITAYATAKAGASSPRSEAAPTAPSETTPAAQASTATPAETPRSGNYPAQPNAADQPAQSSTLSAQGTTAAQPPATDAQAAAGAPKVDTEAAHRSLLAARDALNQLTQLPAAAQLTGEARTQVQQLITNFNELVTNTSDWRSSYDKVSTSLTTLLGPEDADATAAAATPTTPPAATPGAAGTAGAVGTSGTTPIQIDAAIRAKLVEMRTNLKEFQKASGGGAK